MLVPVLQGVEVAGSDRNRAVHQDNTRPGVGGSKSLGDNRARPLSHLNERACKILKKNWSRKIRTETALFLTFSENMRIYTANGLRVKITGFFQEIITPGNKTQDFAKYLFNPVTDTGNTSGTTTGTGTVPGG